jgi:hypothetical protein
LKILCDSASRASNEHYISSFCLRWNLKQGGEAQQCLRRYTEIERRQRRVSRFKPYTDDVNGRVDVVDACSRSDGCRESDVPNPVMSKEEAVIEDDVYGSTQHLGSGIPNELAAGQHPARMFFVTD